MNICKECGFEKGHKENCMMCEAKTEERENIKQELLQYVKDKEFEPTAILDKIKSM